MRFSHQRELIKEILYSTNSHPSAEWVYNKVKKVMPAISLGTVYRNLKKLEEVGSIKTIYDGPIARYDWNKKPHHHLKCRVCEKFIDVELPDIKVEKSVKQIFNFDVEYIDMIFTGVCDKHYNKKQKKE
ncbi:transcriptional repressor [Candidatus Marinimicrobia bacterium]|jgi:Fur family ferric uptake transcriptional regulator/Fur family peroxide stress response transcriptional regulator|nr:transcriptional repressor [Candidatus Neomarinimicrobiota bacterium]MDC0631165.1 transcriptional repressor [Candidatus Neomarinimicrobiota bacterium]